MRTIKAFESGDGAHRGLSDWYPDKEKALVHALASKKPFDTGWYGSKHEIASARIRSEDGKTILVEASVSDDFDTPGSGTANTNRWTKYFVAKAINAAWTKAEQNQKENRVYTGFKILRNTRGYSCYAGGKPMGKATVRPSWVETYIRNDSSFCDEAPPGDNYHKWGFQGEDKIPAKVREKLEDYATSYRAGQPASLTVGKWTIQPWEDSDE